MEKRTCRLAAFGQSSELLVPLDRELLREVIKFEGGRLPPLENGVDDGGSPHGVKRKHRLARK
jgi:hypothetical protein